jgi:pyruvate, water dikinase
MPFTRGFKKLSSKDVSIAGGKGASLGEMTQVGIPVPPGFIILADAFNDFVSAWGLDKKIKKELASVRPGDTKQVNTISKKIRALIVTARFPVIIAKDIKSQFLLLKSPYVAVRSSATAEDSTQASWAGELESYLNTTGKNLLDNVKKCWSSLYTPRAIFYRFEKKLHTTHVAVAVVVQAMIQSEVSGIAFTVHPVTKNYKQMVIEAGYGLGEAIVGGMITPDTYMINKADGQIIDKNISRQDMMIIRGAGGIVKKKVLPANSEKQKMPDNEIMKLAKICKQIEKHYKKPQDIEWAYANKKLYIVQSRPITTLN